MNRRGTWVRCLPPILFALGGLAASGVARPQAAPPPAPAVSSDRDIVPGFVDRYCSGCHNDEDKAAGMDLDAIVSEAVDRHPEAWEKVVRKLAARQMPPPRRTRPGEPEYDAIISEIAGALDRAAAAHPDPGRTDTFRRLNRTEYQNAIRDLLALDVDATSLLPGDPSSHGFDNITVADLSPMLLDRYLVAAQTISHLAVGSPGRSPGGDTIRIRADLTQEEHVEGLPLGTRGGALIPYTFPQDGEYEVQVRLARDRNEHVEGLHVPHELEILLDRERMALLTVTPPRTEREHQTADQHLKARIRATAGPHRLGVTFLKNPSSLLETGRQPYQAHYNMHRHPRISPAIFQVSIIGPYDARDRTKEEGTGISSGGRASRRAGIPEEARQDPRPPEDRSPSPWSDTQGHGDTPSRRRIFVCEPKGPGEEEACARRILSTLIRRAYRRPVDSADLRKPMELYRQARAESGFDAGIEMALASVLVNPQFLFRIEPDPPGVAPHSAYRIPDVQLASRLSFFLWSSIPDDELLDLAERGELSRPGVMEAQARRMLADPRSRSLVTNFAGQWLHLRNLESITPDLRLFPDFDDNLRQAFRRETELLFEEVLREDRSVLDLLRSDHTYLNERLARHYGIPNVYGSRFRRVDIGDGGVRGGLLRQGSILTVTSYATRTSPVIRGKWILENILGTPPPPQPANVPALKDNTVSSSLSVRERLAEHRRDPACAGCHKLMDPPGFALENFDAVGRWRTIEEGRPVDVTGGLPDGSRCEGVTGLEQALLRRPELFVGTLAEKFLTFALGRGVEYYDAPAIRKIVRDARASENRFSSLIVGIATSTPFQMRRSR